MKRFAWRYVFYAAVLAAVVAINYVGCTMGRQAAAQRVAQPAASPDDINPYNNVAGRFLDLDLDGFMADARAAYRSGDYAKAAQNYLFVLQHDARNNWAMYNLACCYGRLGNAPLAAEYLKRAYDAGIDNMEFINQDDEFAAVRGQAAFDEMVESLSADYQRRMREEGSVGFVQTPRLLQYRIKLPENYDPDRSYPLVLGLHGYGSSHNKFITLWEEGEPFIFVAPQAPYPIELDGELGFSWLVWDENDPGLNRRSFELGEQYLFTVINDVTSRYKVSRKFILGFSQGCTVAYGMAIRNPGEFAGLVAFSGRLGEDWLTDAQLNAGNALDVLICHGDRDRRIGLDQAKQTRDLLLDHGYETAFYEFAGGHEIPDDAATLAADWIKEHSGTSTAAKSQATDDGAASAPDTVGAGGGAPQ